MSVGKRRIRCGKITDHRFLCPRKALGRPVRMRRTPRTPKAGSSLVSRWMGSGVAEAVWFVALAAKLGVAVTVTFKTSGRVVVTVTLCPPTRVVCTTAALVVVWVV